MLSYSISICAQNCYCPLKTLRPEIELQSWGITRSFKSQDLQGIALLPLGFCFFHFVLAGRDLRQCGRGAPLFSKRVSSGFQGGTFCGPGLLQSKFRLSTVTTSHQEKHNSPILHGHPNLPAAPSESEKAQNLSCPCWLPAVSPPEKVKSLYEMQPDQASAAGVPFLTELPPPER